MCQNVSGFMPVLLQSDHDHAAWLKQVRSISRFSHQDAQIPPSPLVGEGGKGDEGQARTGMQQTAHLSQELYP